MIEIEQLDHFVLTVESIEVACDFYCEVLGMAVERYGQDRLVLKFGRQQIVLHERGRETGLKARDAVTGTANLCFIAATPIGDIVQRLSHLGVPVVEGPAPRMGASGPIRSIYIRDPDGNLIEISNRIVASNQ